MVDASEADAFPLDIFLAQFAEIYHGVRDGRPSWVVSNTAGSGVFGSIARLDADQASATPCGPLSVAAHVEHLRWSLAYALAYFRGGIPDTSWSGSWSVGEVDEARWRRLRDALRDEYDAVVEAVRATDDWSHRDLRAGTLALVPHGAYHLALIRRLRANLAEAG